MIGRSLTQAKVTFRYYLGMLSFLNEEYAKVRGMVFYTERRRCSPHHSQSEEELTLAFYNCHSEARGNLE